MKRVAYLYTVHVFPRGRFWWQFREFCSHMLFPELILGTKSWPRGPQQTTCHLRIPFLSSASLGGLWLSSVPISLFGCGLWRIFFSFLTIFVHFIRYGGEGDFMLSCDLASNPKTNVWFYKAKMWGGLRILTLCSASSRLEVERERLGKCRKRFHFVLICLSSAGRAQN